MKAIYVKLEHVIAVLLFVAPAAIAQSITPPVTQESRWTQIITKPISDKAVLFTYSGFTDSYSKDFKSYYASPPNLIYKPKRWLELMAAMVIIYNDNKNANDSWEFRPVLGAKFYIPNNRKWIVFSMARFEYRAIVQDDAWQKIPRIRNRIGVEAPLGKIEKAWTPKTFYVLGDVEPIIRLDQNRLQAVRLRAGLGYIPSKKWRAEFIYHAEMTSTAPAPWDHTGNIFRLNIKVNLPRHQQQHTTDVDID